jgi:hypothetical protein
MLSICTRAPLSGRYCPKDEQPRSVRTSGGKGTNTQLPPRVSTFSPGAARVHADDTVSDCRQREIIRQSNIRRERDRLNRCLPRAQTNRERDDIIRDLARCDYKDEQDGAKYQAELAALQEAQAQAQARAQAARPTGWRYR